jgi:hypothetical protein
MDNKSLFLYRLWQIERSGYDTYDSMVVSAYSEEEAKEIYPSREYGGRWGSDVWAYSPDTVNVEIIGLAYKGIKPNEIIISSFNAG